MDFRNSNEAFREIGLDIKEGGRYCNDKPGMPYLDIIKNIKDNFRIPVFAYQVSGEYSLIKYGIERKIIKEDAIIESLMAFKRAGAAAIITYFALDVAQKKLKQLIKNNSPKLFVNEENLDYLVKKFIFKIFLVKTNDFFINVFVKFLGIS